jgi:AcrR family transcriptional regulator
MAGSSRGEASRAAVLAAAVAAASTGGLESLTIGTLATQLGRSKSGLVTLFGSKTSLQLAVVGEGRRVFGLAIGQRLACQPTGWPQTWRLVEAWMACEHDGVFPGGCLLCSLSMEYASRSGPVRDAVGRLSQEWLTTLATAAKRDTARGLLPSGTDPGQVAFGMRAVFLATTWQWKLLGEAAAFTHGRTLATAVLGVPQPASRPGGAGRPR